MSADATAWQWEPVEWRGTHDGCTAPGFGRGAEHRTDTLAELLAAIERCHGGPVYWQQRSGGLSAEEDGPRTITVSVEAPLLVGFYFPKELQP